MKCKRRFCCPEIILFCFLFFCLKFKSHEYIYFAPDNKEERVLKDYIWLCSYMTCNIIYHKKYLFVYNNNNKNLYTYFTAPSGLVCASYPRDKPNVNRSVLEIELCLYTTLNIIIKMFTSLITILNNAYFAAAMWAGVCILGNGILKPKYFTGPSNCFLCILFNKKRLPNSSCQISHLYIKPYSCIQVLRVYQLYMTKYMRCRMFYSKCRYCV